MPYKDPEKQREANRKASKRYRQRKKEKMLKALQEVKNLKKILRGDCIVG